MGSETTITLARAAAKHRDSDMRLTGSYSPLLVFLSVVVASAASYTALDLAGRLSSVTGRARLAWLLGGSLALGVGIWSMHFVACSRSTSRFR